MSQDRVQADSDAISDLRQEFDYFYFDQKAVMERAEWLGAKALDDLDTAEYKWRAKAENCERHLDECLEQARYAAAFGDYVDCSDWEKALEECLHNLRVVRHWKIKVQSSVANYTSAADSLQHWFDFELPKVKRYLDDRIKALRAFLQTHVRTDQ